AQRSKLGNCVSDASVAWTSNATHQNGDQIIKAAIHDYELYHQAGLPASSHWHTGISDRAVR
ncbi:MAG: hypothetical protein VYB63_04505, partial [Chloroflexota bacterium]|nr:hypothetical protein [Chloroflexota bacterium]